MTDQGGGVAHEIGMFVTLEGLPLRFLAPRADMDLDMPSNIHKESGARCGQTPTSRARRHKWLVHTYCLRQMAHSLRPRQAPGRTQTLLFAKTTGSLLLPLSIS